MVTDDNGKTLPSYKEEKGHKLNEYVVSKLFVTYRYKFVAKLEVNGHFLVPILFFYHFLI